MFMHIISKICYYSCQTFYWVINYIVTYNEYLIIKERKWANECRKSSYDNAIKDYTRYCIENLERDWIRINRKTTLMRCLSSIFNWVKILTAIERLWNRCMLSSTVKWVFVIQYCLKACRKCSLNFFNFSNTINWEVINFDIRKKRSICCQRFNSIWS